MKIDHDWTIWVFILHFFKSKTFNDELELVKTEFLMQNFFKNVNKSASLVKFLEVIYILQLT